MVFLSKKIKYEKQDICVAPNDWVRSVFMQKNAGVGAGWQIFVNVSMKKCDEIWKKMGWGRNFMKKFKITAKKCAARFSAAHAQ